MIQELTTPKTQFTDDDVKHLCMIFKDMMISSSKSMILAVIHKRLKLSVFYYFEWLLSLLL